MEFANKLYSEVVDSCDQWPPKGALLSDSTEHVARDVDQTPSPLPPVGGRGGANAGPGAGGVGVTGGASKRAPSNPSEPPSNPSAPLFYNTNFEAKGSELSLAGMGTLAGMGRKTGHEAREGYVVFRREHVERCLSALASDVMIRERSNYDKLVLDHFHSFWILNFYPTLEGLYSCISFALFYEITIIYTNP